MRWIIGDIHGMLRPLETVLRAIDKADVRAQLFFVGDYANRGPDSRQVIDLLLKLENAAFIRGNHDDILDQILNGRSYAGNAAQGDRVAAFTWFMQHGLAETLQSYGAALERALAIANRPTPQRVDELFQCIPAEHRLFLRNLPPVIEDEDLFIAHGKWQPDEATTHPGICRRLAEDELLRQRLLWGRFDLAEIRMKKAWGKVGYFGHTPVQTYLPTEDAEPIRGEQMVLLDTGAALSIHGRLTAWCHESGQVIQANHFGTGV